jgi:hypothetical protein
MNRPLEGLSSSELLMARTLSVRFIKLDLGGQLTSSVAQRS